MKTISPIKKFSLIALALLIAFVCIVPLSVSAAGGGAPTNLYWDGYRAVWTEPGSGAPDNYVVKVYKNGTLSGTMTCFNTSLDVTDMLKKGGNGNYSFEVTANYSNGSYSTSSRSGTISFYDTESGHEHPLAHISFSYPTCTEKGFKEHYECGDCGKYFWDENGKNEITDKSEVVLEPTGHDWGEWKTVKKATETEDGEEQRVCNNDSDHVQTRTIPKLGVESSQTSQDKTEPTTKAKETTVPATAKGDGKSKNPALGKSNDLISGEESENDADDGSAENFLGVSTTWFITIIICAVLLFVIVPGVIVMLILVTRKKKDKSDGK